MARNYDYTCSVMSNWCPACMQKSGGVNLVGGEYHVPSPVTPKYTHLALREWTRIHNPYLQATQPK